MQRSPAIIAYDVADDRRRARLFRILTEWRTSGQLSVHECRLTPREAEELFIQLGQEIEPATDSLLLAWVQPDSRVHALGQARIGLQARCARFA